MNTKISVMCGVVTLIALTAVVNTANAHCEIPCGIYNDALRADLIAEDITTIEKSMKSIIALQKATPRDDNQLVRWIMNKDDHANKLQEIVTQYFMTQRIKPEDAHYEAKIKLLHSMLIFAMKCKQTTDLTYVSKLRSALSGFRKLYFTSGKPLPKPKGPPRKQKK